VVTAFVYGLAAARPVNSSVSGGNMPVKIKKVNGAYQVSTPNGIKAKHTTLKKALAQKKIIDAADAGHPFAGKKLK